MKSIGLLITSTALALVASASAHAAAPVTRAIVYPDRALVTRTLGARCAGPGAASVTFEGLAAQLDPSTLRASAGGAGARVDGVSLYSRVLDENHSEAVRALDEQIEALQAKVDARQRDRGRAEAARARAESLRTTMASFLARESAAERKPNVQAWGEGLDSVRTLCDRADADRLEADRALRELSRGLQDLQRRRAKLTGAGPARVLDAEVLLRCEASGSVRVDLAYAMGGVRWQPVYEARADAAHGQVDLAVLGEVSQATGEDWSDVELVLSTAMTRRDATPPELQRLYVAATPQDDRKKVLVRRYEQVKHVEEQGAEEAGGAAAVADQGLSVQLPVEGKAHVPGDGRAVRVLVERLPLAATFGLLAIPKMIPQVFRSAEVRNSAAFPLLAGRVDLFSNGGYTGSTWTEAVPRGDTLRLAFGIDENVKVHRVVLKEQEKDPSFLGSTRKLIYAYRLEFANAAAKPVEVTVQEHVPVAQIEDVGVAIEPQTTAGYSLAKDDGILSWKLALAPKAKKELELHFTVSIPEKYDSSHL